MDSSGSAPAPCRRDDERGERDMRDAFFSSDGDDRLGLGIDSMSSDAVPLANARASRMPREIR